MPLLQERLNQIRIFLSNEDYNRVSQRLVDLCYDFQFDQPIRDRSLELRAQHNESKELGKASIDDAGLVNELVAFYEEIAALSPAPVSGEGRGEVIAQVNNIQKTFSSRLHNFRFEPLSLELMAGRIIGVVGENGNGKTTLLRMISGELAPTDGLIEYIIDGKPTTNWKHIQRRVAFIPHRLNRWFGHGRDTMSFEAAVKGFSGDVNR